MRIIESSVQLRHPAFREEGVDLLRRIESYARISHLSNERQTDATWEKFIEAVVVKHGDWSVVEHAHATAVFRVNRGVTHELVRHRMMSFTQESSRFVNGRKSYPNGLEFILPEELKGVADLDPERLLLITNELINAENTYLRLLDLGSRPQEARAVLPNALAATIAVTGNLRAWRHVLRMRTTRETHPDFRVVMIKLLAMFQARVPILYDDIVPNGSQADAVRLPC
jgi:thymidylate synthase (FAD)